MRTGGIPQQQLQFAGDQRRLTREGQSVRHVCDIEGAGRL